MLKMDSGEIFLSTHFSTLILLHISIIMMLSFSSRFKRNTKLKKFIVLFLFSIVIVHFLELCKIVIERNWLHMIAKFEYKFSKLHCDHVVWF